jgi:hypothetical protein
MIWASSIYDLQYYNQPPPPAPCYCEQLVYPGDLLLQGSFSSSAISGFTITVDVYTPDGVNVLEASATSLPYFSYYFFNYNGTRYFNLRLNGYSPAMCANPCWILRVRAHVNGVTVFDKYTQRYCQTTCCDTPRGITFTPTGVINPVSPQEPPTTSIPLSECGMPLIRIEVEFPCLDNQLGDFYGIPTTVYSGTASFAFKKITNITAKIRQRPREITREISYNCNTQRVESFKPYLLESVSNRGVFPTWKMNEIEGMFHAPTIYITDFKDENTYQFAGGIICELLYKCWEIFKLKTVLQSCSVRQVYGCNEGCDTASEYTFLVPEDGNDDFYSENNTHIGGYEALLNWYRAQSGVSSVVDNSGTYANTDGSFTVTGSGYIPTSFYYNSISRSNRVFGTTNPVAPVISCAMPVLGTAVVEDQVCTTPVLGTAVVEDMPEELAAVNDYGNWDVDQSVSNVVLSESYGRLNITTANTTLVADPTTISNWQQISADMASADITVPDGDCLVLIYAAQTYQRTVDFTQAGSVVTMTNGVIFAIGDEVTVGMQDSTNGVPYLTNEIIGVISPNGRPAAPYIVETDDYTLVIDITGNILYTGYPTTTDGTGSEIIITNLYYSL